jgi:hypothetical protein
VSSGILATRLRELRRDWPLDQRGKPERRVKLEQNIRVRRDGKLEV